MEDNSAFVAAKARETFLAIRKLRKEMPQRTRAEKNLFEAESKKLQEKWWNEVKHKMKRGPHPWDGHGFCPFCDKE